MGYARPTYWYEGKDGKLHRDIRRQHAVTVWNVMAAVVMVAVVHSIGDHERKEAAVKAYYDGLEDFFKYR